MARRSGLIFLRPRADLAPRLARATAAVRDADVARRAYEIWERAGRPDGRDREHWAQAERELAARRPGR